MELSPLALIISRNAGCSGALACALAWRILNEYPEPFRLAALALAEGRAPELRVGEISFQTAKDISHQPDFTVLELMYVLARDDAAGRELLFRFGAHDRIER